MSIADKLNQLADETAANVQHEASRLDAEIAKIEAQKAKLAAQRDMARTAVQRRANYRVKSGSDFSCPVCWVSQGKLSPLLPRPSDTNDDLFRCSFCQLEVLIQYR